MYSKLTAALIGSFLLLAWLPTSAKKIVCPEFKCPVGKVCVMKAGNPTCESPLKKTTCYEYKCPVGKSCVMKAGKPTCEVPKKPTGPIVLNKHQAPASCKSYKQVSVPDTISGPAAKAKCDTACGGPSRMEGTGWGGMNGHTQKCCCLSK
jgi:hypothetical protein